VASAVAEAAGPALAGAARGVGHVAGAAARGVASAAGDGVASTVVDVLGEAVDMGFLDTNDASRNTAQPAREKAKGGTSRRTRKSQRRRASGGEAGREALPAVS
jgi:hypothetical protein